MSSLSAIYEEFICSLCGETAFLNQIYLHSGKETETLKSGRPSNISEIFQIFLLFVLISVLFQLKAFKGAVHHLYAT